MVTQCEYQHIALKLWHKSIAGTLNVIFLVLVAEESVSTCNSILLEVTLTISSHFINFAQQQCFHCVLVAP